MALSPTAMAQSHATCWSHSSVCGEECAQCGFDFFKVFGVLLSTVILQVL
jgi:hypothetical protein